MTLGEARAARLTCLRLALRAATEAEVWEARGRHDWAADDREMARFWRQSAAQWEIVVQELLERWELNDINLKNNLAR